MSESELSEIIKKSYSVFRKNNTVNLIKIGDTKVLELFHGPTLAFKDIAMQLLGNFYEHHLNKNNKSIIEEIKNNNRYIISKEKVEKIKKNFLSASMKEKEVLSTIKKVYEKYKIILDPHSAIGFGALNKVKLEGDTVVLATAHPCKFPDAIDKSINVKPRLPEKLKYILDEKENYDIISNDPEKIKKYIRNKIKWN